MTSMNEADYLEQRLQDQLDWYSNKSSYFQKRYKFLRLLEIIAAAIIPFLSGLVGKAEWIVYAIGILGIVIAVSAAISAMGKYHEYWIQYRTTAEQLKQEKFMFMTCSGPYEESEGRFTELVERVEALIAKENATWAKIASKQNKTAGNKATG